MRTVNVLLNWARAEGEQVNAKAKLAKPPKPIVEPLSREEVATMERAANERDALIVRMLADTGIRAAELTGLRVEDVTGDRRIDYIRVRGKGAKDRMVPLPALTARRLRRYIRGRPAGAQSDRVFLGNRRDPRSGEYEPLTVSGLEQMVRTLARNAGIARRVYPHAFRHAYITELLKRGVDTTKIRRVGHESTQLMDRVYGHLIESDLADSVLGALRE